MNIKILSHLSRSLLILLSMLGLALAAEAPRLQQMTHAVLSPTSEQVVLKLNGSYSPKAFTLKGQSPRLVFDFAGMTQAVRVKNLMQLSGPFLQSIRVGMHAGDTPKTRVVFDLKTLEGMSYSQNFNEADSSLTIRFTSKNSVDPVPAPTAETQTEEKPEKPIKKAAVRPSIAQKPHKKAPEATAKSTQPSSAAKPEKKAQKTPQKAAQKTPAKGEPPQPEVTAPQKTVQNAPLTDQKTKLAPAQASPKKPGPQVTEQPAKTPKESKPEVKKPAKQASAPNQQKLQAPAAPPKPELLSIKFDPASPKGEMVMFKLNGFYPPSVHGVEEGIPRVICDFNKTTLKAENRKRIDTDGKYVKALRISTTQKPEKVRVVIDLEPNRSYDLQQVFFKDDDLFVIIVNTIKK